MTALLIFVTLIIWDRACREHSNLRGLQVNFKLFALRDELREFAMTNPAAASSWLFAYLDSAIARSVLAVPRASVWKVLAAFLGYRHDHRFLAHHRNLASELAKPKNEKYQQVYMSLMDIYGDYLLRRHISLILFGLLGWGIGRTYEQIKKKAIAFFIESESSCQAEEAMFTLEPAKV